VLSQSYRVGKKHRGLYLRLVVDTRRGKRTAYLNGRVLKRWPDKLLIDGNPPVPGQEQGPTPAVQRALRGRNGLLTLPGPLLVVLVR
jgi:hypothetical protein